MRFFLLLVCLLLTLQLDAQDQEKLNTLLANLQQTEDITCKAEILCDLSLEHRKLNPKMAANYGKQAISLAQKTGNKFLLAQAYNNTGAGYYLLGDYESATSYFYGALKLREEVGDSAGMRSSYINIANIFASQGDYDSALLHYKKALRLAKLNKDNIAASGALNNIGQVYQSLKQYDLALSHFNRALPLKEELNDTKGIIASLINIGNIYNIKGYHITALASFNKALVLTEQIGSLHDKVYILRGKALSYKLDKDYKKAIEFGTQSFELAKVLNEKNQIKLSAATLNDIYSEIGDYANAYYYLNLYSVYTDSISSERIKNQIALVQVKYETEKKAKENMKLIAEHKLHVKELEQKEIIQNFFIAIIVLVCVVALTLFAGSRRLKRVNAILLEKNQQITYSSTILSSQKEALTEQAGQLKVQKEELERLNGIKDRLFSVIAHDLRGPLVSLKGLLQVMAKGKLPANKQEELFKSLVKGQQNVLWMLDNLFDWARAQMKGFEVEKQALAVKSLTNENIRLLQPIAINKEIRIENRIPEDIVVFADKEMLRLVLRNLISNAIKFCSAGDLIVISSLTLGDVCTITVQDTGIGISEDVQQKLFGKSNYSSRGTDNEKGSGLGLSLCKDFILQNGGTIWVESTLGKGSAFKFTLPAYATTAPAQSAVQQPLAAEA